MAIFALSAATVLAAGEPPEMCARYAECLRRHHPILGRPIRLGYSRSIYGPGGKARLAFEKEDSGRTNSKCVVRDSDGV